MAFATGTINSTAYTDNPIYIDFNFSDVDGNLVDSIGETDSGNWTHHGQTAGTGKQTALYDYQVYKTHITKEKLCGICFS